MKSARAVALVSAFMVLLNMVPVDAHFFGTTKQIDGYELVFSPSPDVPVAGSNSTYLNFSVLQNGTNIPNIQAAVVISEKNSDVLVEQLPYRVYEFSDLSVRYTFPKAGEYTVTLLVRITDHEKYQATPLEARFDLNVENPGAPAIPLDELMLFYVTPASVVIAALSVYLHSKKKL